MKTAYSGSEVTPEYLKGYAIGYFYGREHGDEDPARVEMAERFGESDATNLAVYEGFKVGYPDGVNDYVRFDAGESV